MRTMTHYCDYLQNSEGEPRSNKIEKLAVALLADLEASEEYMFDPTYGNKIIQFAELVSGFKLYRYQEFLFHTLYSWRRKDNGLRRFNNAYISLARKGAKSWLASVIALYELMNGQDKQIYVAANSLRQAQNLYNMVAQNTRSLMNVSKAAGKLLDLYSKKVSFDAKNSYIEVLSGNAKKLDGLNVACFILDEFSMSPTTELRDVLASSQLLQASPLNIIISTHSMELSYPWLTQELPYLNKILDGELPLTNYLPVFYELDNMEDVADERMWAKANPVLLEKPSVAEYLRGELERARMTGDLTPVLTKNFNLVQDRGLGAMFKLADYEENLSSVSLLDFAGKDVFVGVDLSYSNDLSSVVYSFIHEGKVHVYTHSYVAEREDYTLAERSRETGINFGRLREQGQVSVHQDRIQSNLVALDIIETVEHYGFNLKGIYFDNSFSSSFIEKLNSEGYGSYLREVRQGAFTLSPATQSFVEFLTQGKVRFIPNELMREALLNVREKRVNDCLYYDKQVNRRKIDPFAALINTFKEVPFADLDVSTVEKLSTWKF